MHIDTSASTFHSAEILSDDSWKEEHCEVSFLKQITQEKCSNERIPSIPSLTAATGMVSQSGEVSQSELTDKVSVSELTDEVLQPLQDTIQSVERQNKSNPVTKPRRESIASASSSKDYDAMPRHDIQELVS